MIIPIIIYDNSILRYKCKKITPCYPNLKKLIFDMFETMNNANGIGLSAPQIGKKIRLFIINNISKNKINKLEAINKKVFINPKILKIYGNVSIIEEGCLSIPGIIVKIKRLSHIIIEYYDEYWNKKIKTLNGFFSRVIQHEYDHIQGKLFIDHLSFTKKMIIKNKLKNISRENFYINYPYHM